MVVVPYVVPSGALRRFRVLFFFWRFLSFKCGRRGALDSGPFWVQLSLQSALPFYSGWSQFTWWYFFGDPFSSGRPIPSIGHFLLLIQFHTYNNHLELMPSELNSVRHRHLGCWITYNIRVSKFHKYFPLRIFLPPWILAVPSQF